MNNPGLKPKVKYVARIVAGAAGMNFPLGYTVLVRNRNPSKIAENLEHWIRAEFFEGVTPAGRFLSSHYAFPSGFFIWFMRDTTFVFLACIYLFVLITAQVRSFGFGDGIFSFRLC